MFVSREPRSRAALVAVVGGLCLILCASAGASGKTRKATRGKKAKAVKTSKAVKKSKAPPTLPQALVAIRAHLAEAGRKGKPSDLATLMIGGLIELGFVQAIHGHYALAGVGQSHRSGAMSAASVQLAARDMERNYARLVTAYKALAGQAEFKGQLAGLFGSLAALCEQARLASVALGHWTEAKTSKAAATAFETRLEAYRKAVAAFAKQTRGG